LDALALAFEGAGLRAKWLAEEGKRYSVEAAPDLANTFAVISPQIYATAPGESVAEFVVVDGATQPAGFYRIRREP